MREGTKVVFQPSPASRALYSYRVPKAGTHGVVTPVAGPRGPMTRLFGPGGGLVYVQWADGSFVGVSKLDLKRPAKGRRASCGCRATGRRDSVPTKEADWKLAKGQADLRIWESAHAPVVYAIEKRRYPGNAGAFRLYYGYREAGGPHFWPVPTRNGGFYATFTGAARAARAQHQRESHSGR